MFVVGCRGFSADTSHAPVGIHQHCVVLADRLGVIVLFHGEHRSGLSLPHCSDHPLKVLGDEEDVAQEQEDRRGNMGLKLPQGVGDAQGVTLLNVFDPDAQGAAVAEGLGDLVAKVTDHHENLRDPEVPN